MIGEEEKNLEGLIKTYVQDYGMRCIIIDTTRHREHPVDYAKIPLANPLDIPVSRDKRKIFRKGVVRVIISQKKEAEEFMWKLNGFDFIEKKRVQARDGITDTLVVVEESALLLPQRMEDTAWEYFAVESKNIHNSIAFMFHGWMWIPPRMLSVANEFVIFKTSADTPQDRGIKNRDVLAAYDRVMAHSSQHYHETVKNG